MLGVVVGYAVQLATRACRSLLPRDISSSQWNRVSLYTGVMNQKLNFLQYYSHFIPTFNTGHGSSIYSSSGGHATSWREITENHMAFPCHCMNPYNMRFISCLSGSRFPFWYRVLIQVLSVETTFSITFQTVLNFWNEYTRLLHSLNFHLAWQLQYCTWCSTLWRAMLVLCTKSMISSNQRCSEHEYVAMWDGRATIPVSSARVL